jgi:hypothetical protein
MGVMAAIAINLDCILIGIIAKLIAISSDCVLMIILSNQLQSARIVHRWMSTMVLMVGSTVGSMVGSTVGSMVGLMVGSTWLCWAINLSEVFDSSDERLLRLSAKRV